MSFPPGPLPPTAEADILAIMQEVGVAKLSLKDLRQTLQNKYKVDLLAQKEILTGIVTKALAAPQFAKVVSDAQAKEKKAAKSAKPEVAAKVKAVKAVKPDNYPKGAQTSYFAFLEENRPKVSAENPSLAAKDLVKKLAELYRALSPEESERYTAIAKKDKERYDTEMAAFLAGGGEKTVRASKDVSKDGKVKKVKDPNMPKRPLSAFFMFANEKRPEVTKEVGGNIGLIGKRMGEMWAAVTPEEKTRFEGLAGQDKLRFAKECEERGYPVPGAKTARSE